MGEGGLTGPATMTMKLIIEIADICVRRWGLRWGYRRTEEVYEE